MNSSKKLEEIKSLIPIYLKKINSGEKWEEIEKAFNQQELKKELNFWEIVNKGYDKIKGDLPEHDKNIFPKIINKIKNKHKRQRIFFNFFNLNPRYSLFFLLAQFLVIIGLVFYTLSLKLEYKTLSINNIEADAGVSINIVFNENAKEIEIRKLLQSIDGNIIDGPYITGLYVIAIKDKANKDVALETLKKSNIILFAEPAN